MYCVWYHIHQDKIKIHPERVAKYKPYLNQFEFSKIKFPASLHEVKKVEKIKNRINVHQLKMSLKERWKSQI